MANPKNMEVIKTKTDKVIFYTSLIFLLLLTFPLLLWPEESQGLLSRLKVLIEDYVGSVYQLLAIAVLIFVIWIAVSKYGKIVLGKNDYNFNTFSWASMLFCAGVATGILYWGTIEWAYYIDKPPFGLTPGSNDAFELAATYGMFHWGVIGWAFYSLPAVGIGYMYYVKKVPVLRISKACSRILGKHTDGLIGKSMDVFFMIGLLGSTGTSMGLGTPMISAGVSEIFGLPDTFELKLVVIFFAAIIFSISVYLGLGKGIKKLSNFNTITAFLFLVLVCIVGPATFILKMGVNSLGILVQDFVRMATWTDPLTDSRFVEDWTIFYWAWWVAVGPFMGIFIAKISGGRSIRQIIWGTIGFGSLGCMLFYGVLGNYAIHLELTDQLPIVEMVRNGNPSQAIIAIISSLAPGKIILIIFCLMSVVFMATSFDSTSYTLASCATEKLPAKQDPSRWQRLFWAFTLILLPIALMYVGGLESLKIAVLISAFPLIFVYLILGVSLYKNLKEH
jgi:BCCT family betaine/carnitine transporter